MKTTKSSVKKKSISRTKKKSKSSLKAKKSAKKKAVKKEWHHLPVRTESEQFAGLHDDLHDAWFRLRSFLTSLGEQRIHTSHSAIMFSRKTCYAFFRPKKKYIEACIFLPNSIDHEWVKKAEATSKTKFANIVQFTHPDQIEWPITDWFKEAFNYAQ